MVNQFGKPNYMKFKYPSVLLLLFFISVNLIHSQPLNEIKVSTDIELKQAIKEAVPGTNIVMSNGSWKNVEIKFSGKGTKKRPIILRAETPGKVKLEGQSDLKLSGEYLEVKDLIFTNGYSPSNAVIEFRIAKNKIANNSTVKNIVIEDYSQPNRSISDLWVLFWGRHNTLDSSYLAGKFNEGPTLRVALDGNEHIKNYHQITNNHFGPRPRKGGPKAETIQIGSSETSMAPSFVNVSNNLFEECNGEVEVISNKSSFNEFKNNIFYKSEGSLVLRHGNYCTVEGNVFIGDGISPYYGGIRVINTGHMITNNYFYKLRGDEFRSPLAIMNGIPKSPLNRYNQVTDVVVAYNTWVDSPTPWHISVGANADKGDILPLQEIRSARPERILIANNLVYSSAFNNPVIKAYDQMDGVSFKNNIVGSNIQVNAGVDGISAQPVTLKKLNEYIYVPEANQPILKEQFPGFEFDKIETDIFGADRGDYNTIGAFGKSEYSSEELFDLSSYGPKWFFPSKNNNKSKTLRLTSKDLLNQKIKTAMSGDIIELEPGNYNIDYSIVIDKEITIKSKNPKRKAKINFIGNEGKPLFELHPKSHLKLDNLDITGSNKEVAFATKEKEMSYAYNLTVDNSFIKNFDVVLKAYKNSFADEIVFNRTHIKDSNHGLLLNSEVDDLGDYNAEFVKISNSEFNNISGEVIDYYRGGYDESTIGGNLDITGTRFENSGQSAENDILIKNRGIVNVNLTNNTFINNKVETIAILWGEMGNIDKENRVENSGEIKTEKYLKQKLVY